MAALSRHSASAFARAALHKTLYGRWTSFVLLQTLSCQGGVVLLLLLLLLLLPVFPQDIDWAISAKVDFIAVSFVRTADVITNLRSYIQTRIAAQEQQEGPGGCDLGFRAWASTLNSKPCWVQP
jgi:hypothetical protein